MAAASAAVAVARVGTACQCTLPESRSESTGPRGIWKPRARKFRYGIYLVYTWYILLVFLILVYTRYMTGIQVCFLGKSIFVYH
jgi:predicted membrane channel-forming protein YqfA (hemolysin III family)